MNLVHDTQLTPLAFLERAGRVWADKVAIVDDGVEHTYAAFAAQA